MKSKQFSDAINLLDAYTRANPRAEDTPRALLLKGNCESMLPPSADQAKAVQTWEWLIRGFPKTDEAAKAYKFLADFHAGRNSPKREEAALRDMLRQFPEHHVTIEVWTSKAEALMAGGNHQMAFEAFQKVAAVLPPKHREMMDLCQSWSEATGNPERLLEHANRIFLSRPLEATAAYEEYCKRVPSSPNLAQAKTRLAFCYARPHEKTDLDRAEKIWREVVGKGPSADEWVQESRWYLIQLLAGPRNQWQRAVTEAAKLAETSRPGTFRHEQALFTQAWLHWANSDWRGALAGFEELLSHYPAKATHAPIQAYLEECRTKLQ